MMVVIERKSEKTAFVLFAFVLFAFLFFSGMAIYNIGYVKGYESKTCGRAECMSEILKYTR